MISYVVGDATAVQRGAILHVVNDVGAWGRGFTQALDARFNGIPGADYRDWYRSGLPRLGDVRVCPVQTGVAVVHLFAQHGIGRGLPRVSYSALRDALVKARGLYVGNGRAVDVRETFHMPRIGCGLGGGEWSAVEPIVAEFAVGLDVTVYDLPGPM